MRRDTLAEGSEAGVLQPEVDEIIDDITLKLILYSKIVQEVGSGHGSWVMG